MNAPEPKKWIVINLAYWLVAMLIHPVLRLIPTSTGSPAKIFEFLVPLFFIMLAAGSTWILKTAMGRTQ